MKTNPTVPLLILVGALCMATLSAATGAEPAPTAPAVTQAVYNDAVGKIDRASSRKPQEACAAYLAYLDGTPGLAENMRLDLHRRILISALAADRETYDRHWARVNGEPDGDPKANMLQALMRDLAKAGATQLAEAEALYARLGDRLTLRQRFATIIELAGGTLRNSGDLDRFTAWYEATMRLEAPGGADAAAVATVEKQRTETLVALAAALMRYDGEAAQRLVAASGERFNAAERLALSLARMLAALDNKDRRAFDAALADFEKHPDDAAKLPHYAAVTTALARDDRETAESILRQALKRPGYTDAQRHTLLLQLRMLNRPRAFNYGFFTPGAYEGYRVLADEDLLVVGRALTDGTLKRDRTLAGQFHELAQTADEFGDHPFAAAMLAEARGSHPLDFAFVPLALSQALRSNSLDAVRAVIDPILANEKESAANTSLLRAIRSIVEHRAFKTFDADVFGGQPFTDAERMLLIRRASEILFRGERYDLCRLAHEEVFQNMFTPVNYKSYAVQSLPNAPRTADGWARSTHYGNWARMETRFVPYGDGYDMGNSTDIARHLKSAPPPAIPDGYRTGVHLVHDETGLHIYIRCDDPAVGEIVAGTRKGDSIELLVRPGEDAAYHSWYFNAPPQDNDEPHLVNWASPTPRYRLTYDHFTKDSTTTPEAVVAHTFIPWLAFYDRLPVDGTVWTFGMQRWGRHAVTLSGSVHELARALALSFTFTPAELTAIKRHVAVQAFNRYHAIRQNAGEFIQTWNNPVLGDPAFYAAELAPLLDELDQAGRRLTAPAPDADIAAIYERDVPQWAEINHAVAERRNAYLRRALLK
jgi:hypothetical protein